MMTTKIDDAEKLIRACRGSKGMWASTGRYRHQCWTRDFCIATSYLLMHYPALQSLETVFHHLYNTATRQKFDGKIPILYLDDEMEFLRDKIEKSLAARKISFMLKRYLDRDIENLTPHTRDSELLYIITASEFLDAAKRQNYQINEVAKNMISSARILAMDYIEKNLLVDGLVPGADWRDTREDLNDKCVLTNACLLYKAYTALSMRDKATQIKNILQEKFWNGEYFIDYVGCDNFDILGNSLAIIYGIVDNSQTNSIFEYAVANIQTEFGFKMSDTFLPALDEKERTIMERDKAVIWPFTNGFLLDAMLTHGGTKWHGFVESQFAIWSERKGFYEWYDIVEGNGYGSVNQTWSAALYLRIAHKLGKAV
jgi:hypothetical protein